MRNRKIAALQKKIAALQEKHSLTYLSHYGGEIAQKQFALSMISEQIRFAQRKLAELLED